MYTWNEICIAVIVNEPRANNDWKTRSLGRIQLSLYWKMCYEYIYKNEYTQKCYKIKHDENDRYLILGWGYPWTE